MLVRRLALVFGGILIALLLAPGSATAALITVDTLDDAVVPVSNGQCSLREALQAAGSNLAVDSCAAGAAAALDEIRFDSALIPADPMAPFQITLAGARLNVSGLGDLAISGPAQRRLSIDANELSTVLNISVDASATLALEHLRLTGGAGAQGAMRLGSAGTTVLRDVHFVGNAATDRGGAIGGYLASAITIEIQDCLFENNTSDSFGGAIGITTLTAAGSLSLSVRGSRFVTNTTGQFGRGGAIFLFPLAEGSNMSVLIDDSVFSQNVADVEGGAISAGGLSTSDSFTIRLTRSLFIANVATGGGGGGARLSSANAIIQNTTWIANQAEGTSGALQLSNFSAAVDRDLIVTGNTFYQNISEGIVGSTEHGRWGMHPSAGSNNVVVGNLFVSRNDSSFDGCAVNNLAFADSVSRNVSNDPSCINSATDVGVADAKVALADNNALQNVSIALLPGSAAIDAWPMAECALTADMLGAARPTDGNDDGSSDCDSGATEAPTGRRLTVSTAGSGSGSVSTQPAGISCGPDCETAFPLGSAVTVVASAAPGSVFSGWSGECESQTSVCDLSMSDRRQLVANFTLDVRSSVLSVALSGPGLVASDPSGIYCTPTCSASLPNGQIGLLAIPDIGATHVWGGACAGTLDTLCDVNLSAGTEVSVAFVAQNFDLNVTSNGTGAGTVSSMPAGIACPADCNELFPAATVVTLSALAQPGNVFAGWTGACSGSASCVVTMDQMQTVNAEFQQRVSLDVTLVGQGRVVSDVSGIDCPGLCAADYDQFTVVQLIAAPASGWRTTSWEGCSPLPMDPNRCQLSLLVPASVTTTFEMLPDPIFVDGFE